MTSRRIKRCSVCDTAEAEKLTECEEFKNTKAVSLCLEYVCKDGHGKNHFCPRHKTADNNCRKSCCNPDDDDDKNLDGNSKEKATIATKVKAKKHRATNKKKNNDGGGSGESGAEEEEDEAVFDVAAILDDRDNVAKQCKEYLVWWAGFPKAEATWEPFDHFTSPNALADYYTKKAATQKKRKDPEDKKSSDQPTKSRSDEKDKGQAEFQLQNEDETKVQEKVDKLSACQVLKGVGMALASNPNLHSAIDIVDELISSSKKPVAIKAIKALDKALALMHNSIPHIAHPHDKKYFAESVHPATCGIKTEIVIFPEEFDSAAMHPALLSRVPIKKDKEQDDPKSESQDDGQKTKHEDDIKDKQWEFAKFFLDIDFHHVCCDHNDAISLRNVYPGNEFPETVLDFAMLAFKNQESNVKLGDSQVGKTYALLGVEKTMSVPSFLTPSTHMWCKTLQNWNEQTIEGWVWQQGSLCVFHTEICVVALCFHDHSVGTGHKKNNRLILCAVNEEKIDKELTRIKQLVNLKATETDHHSRGKNTILFDKTVIFDTIASSAKVIHNVQLQPVILRQELFMKVIPLMETYWLEHLVVTRPSAHLTVVEGSDETSLGKRISPQTKWFDPVQTTPTNRHPKRPKDSSTPSSAGSESSKSTPTSAKKKTKTEKRVVVRNITTTM